MEKANCFYDEQLVRMMNDFARDLLKGAGALDRSESAVGAPPNRTAAQRPASAGAGAPPKSVCDCF